LAEQADFFNFIETDTHLFLDPDQFGSILIDFDQFLIKNEGHQLKSTQISIRGSILSIPGFLGVIWPFFIENAQNRPKMAPNLIKFDPIE